MRARTVPFVLVLLVGLTQSALSLAGQEDVESGKVVVRGAAPLQGGVSAARQRALQQAFRAAVEQVAGVIVESETLVENLILFEDHILTRTEGYVRSYDILHEAQEDDIFVVELAVEVFAGPLSRDLASLGILLRRADYPTISVELSSESRAGLPPETGTRLRVEATSLLEDRGLDVIQPSESGLEPSVRIVATVEFADQGDVTGLGMESATAIIALEAIEATTGVVMATGRSRSKGAGISVAAARDQAGARALEDGIGELADDLIGAWSNRVNNSDVVLVNLRGVSSLSQVERLIARMEDDFGETRNVTLRQANVDRGTALVQWRGRSDSRALANWLNQPDFAQELIVLSVAGNLIRLEFFGPGEPGYPSTSHKRGEIPS